MRVPTLRSKAWRIAAAASTLAAMTLLPAAAEASTAAAKPLPTSVQIKSASTSGLAQGAIKHVWLIILENKSYDATFTGLNQNTELWKTLPSQGVLLKNYYGTGHFSQDNYESLVSGQAPQQDTQSDCDVAYKDFGSNVVTDPSSPNYGQAASTQGAYTGLQQGKDGTNGCVYPASVPTLFNQFDANGTTWKGYAQDAGSQPGREDLACFGPGSSAANNNPTTNPTNEQGTKPAGVTSYTGAQSNDQYVAKHFPFPWFHSLIDNTTDCDSNHIANLDSASNGLVHDLQNNTAPNFSWITPNNCSDAHDAVCAGNNLSGAFSSNGQPNYTAGSTAYNPQTTTPTNYTGGLYASDLFLKYYIPLIEGSQAFKDGGLIDVTFDEGNPPFVSGGGQSFNNADQYTPTATDKPDKSSSIAADAAGENINGQNVSTEPAGPNTPLGFNGTTDNGNQVANPGPGDSGFIDRTPAGARTDTGVFGIQGQNLITDNKISEYDAGRSVTGTNIPAGAFVGSPTDTGPTAATQGGSAVNGSFSLVDASGNPITPIGQVSTITLGARTASTDPLYDPSDQTPGGGDTGSVLISPFIKPGTSTTTYYNHYSWLRTMEDLFSVSNGTANTPIANGAGTVSGGLDGQGHIGYAAQSGLAPFGPDVFNNPAGTTQPPVSTPEAPLAIGLPIAALVLAGGFVLYRRRQHRVSTAS